MSKTEKKTVLRMLVVVLSAIVLLGILSVATLAADSAEVRYTIDGGANWNDASFADAVSAAISAESATIELQKSITHTASTAITGGNITIQSKEGQTYSINRGSTFANSMFKISGGATVTFKNITLDGQNHVVSANAPMILLTTANDTVVLDSGATIQNSYASVTSSVYKDGGAIYAPQGNIQMKNGATIRNCQAYKGGGIYLGNKSATANCATFTMSGGLITGCTSLEGIGWGSGAALYIDGRATFNMLGGLITGNTSYRYGNAAKHLDGEMIDGAVALANTTTEIKLSQNAMIRGNKAYRAVNGAIGAEPELGADIVFNYNTGGAAVINIAEGFSGSVGFAYPRAGTDIGTVAVATAAGYSDGVAIHGLIDTNFLRMAKVTGGKVYWDVAEAEVDIGGKITRYATLEAAYTVAGSETPIKLLANVSNVDFFENVEKNIRLILGGNSVPFGKKIVCGDPEVVTEKVGAFTYGAYSYQGTDATVSTYTHHVTEGETTETTPEICTLCGCLTALPTDTTIKARYSLDGGKTWTYATFVNAIKAVNGKTGIVEIYRDINLTSGVAVSALDLTVRSLPMGQNAVDENKVYTISRGTSFTGTCFTVAANAKLTFADVTLNGKNKSVSANGAMISLAASTSTVVLDSGATIQNSCTSGSGGAIYAAQGNVQMLKGSTIQNCEANKGGGIYLGNTSTKNSATFTMEGGLITGCKIESQWGSGAAVYMAGWTVFDMSGGLITGNTSGRFGRATEHRDGEIIDGAVAASANYKKVNAITISGNAIIRDNYGYRWDAETQTYPMSLGADVVYTIANVEGDVCEQLVIAKDFTGSVGLAFPTAETGTTQVVAAANDYTVGTIISGLIDNNAGRVAKVTSSGVICWVDAEAELDIGGKITRYVSLEEAYAIAGSETPIKLISDATVTLAKLGDSIKIIENGYTLNVMFDDGGSQKSEGEQVTIGSFTYEGHVISGKTVTVYTHTAIEGASISNVALVAETDLSIRFYANLGTKYADAVLLVTRNGKTAELKGTYDNALGMHCFVYEDIAPQCAGDLISGELVCGEESLDTFEDYSVLQYCQKALAMDHTALGLTSEKCEELKTLLSDLLVYCASAQVYTGYQTGALVDDGVVASEFFAPAFSPRSIVVNNTVEGVSFVEAGLRFDNVNNLWFTFTTPDLKNTRLVVNGVEHTSDEFTLYSGTNTYVWYTEDLYATQFDEIFTVKLYSGDTLVQTLTYSVGAYVNSMLEHEEEIVVKLAKATYNYGVSACFYEDKYTDKSYSAKDLSENYGAHLIGGKTLKGTALAMSNVASGIEFSFLGKGDVVLNITAEEASRFEIKVDGATVNHFLVDKGTANYTIASGLSYGKHTVCIVKENGSFDLNSVSVNGYFVAEEKEEKLYIEFIGSDVLLGREAYLNGNSIEDDATATYAVLAARELDARYLISDINKTFIATDDIPDLVVIDYETGVDYEPLLANMRAAYGNDVEILFVSGAIDTIDDIESAAIAKLGGEQTDVTTDTLNSSGYPSMGGAAIQGAELAQHIRMNYSFFTKDEIAEAETDMIVEVAEAVTGFNSFYVYVKTSDPSGDYYIRYNFMHEYNTVYSNKGADSTTNISNFRIKGANLVKVTNVDLENNKVTYEAVLPVLQAGEVSAALKTMSNDGGTTSEDFTGGYHGDEWIIDASNGAPAVSLVTNSGVISVVNGEPTVVYCNALTFDQTTMMYEWGTSDPDAADEISKRGTPLVLHTQHFTITRESGIQNRQSFEWQKDVKLNTGSNYLQMFTVYRYQNSKNICTDLSSYNANGRINSKATASGKVENAYSVLSNSTNRQIHYSGKESGVSAYANYDLCYVGGFENNQAKIAGSSVQVRASQGDNKLYVKFVSAAGGESVKANELWTLDVSYGFDYVNPNN